MTRHMVIMFRFFLMLGCILYATLGLAKAKSPQYQIDIVLFTHAPTAEEHVESPYAISTTHHEPAITLKEAPTSSNHTYQVLTKSLSGLQDQIWALNHKGQYNVLMNYSWLQPENNQKSIALPLESHKGWQVDGIMKVVKSAYYQLNTDLQFTAPGQNQPTFTLAQNQRLKPNVIYYLDHPQIGMLIKIHPVA